MILRSLVTAFRTLTVIPLPGKDTGNFHLSLIFFLPAGAFLGILHPALFWVLIKTDPGMIALSGLALCAVNYLSTGALHLDGLGDTADAFGMKRDREKTLQILKDPHLGSYGVAAVVLMVLWRVTIYHLLAEADLIIWIVPCLALSRAVQGTILCVFPYARGNSGKAFMFSGRPRYAIFLSMEIVAVVAALFYFTGPIGSFLPVLTGFFAMIPVICLYFRRIRGITGDGVGACSELFEMGFLSVVMILFS